MPTVKRGLNFLSCVSGILVPLKQTIGYSPTLVFLYMYLGANTKTKSHFMNTQNLKKPLYLLILLAGLLPVLTHAQNAKDWYCPKVTFNKVTFYMPDVNTGNPTEATRTIYYINKRKNYEITNASLFDGQPIAIETNTIAFVGNEVKLLSKVVTNSLGVTSKKTTYSPNQTIFRVPINGNSTYWMFSGQKYSSIYSTFIFNGIECKAIKVTQYQPRWNGKTVRYYLVGYGIVETDIISDDGKIIISDKFSGRTYGEGIVSSSNDHELGNTKQKIIITQTPQTIPIGKRWILVSGEKTTIQISDGSLTSGTFCNAMLLSNPHITFNINKGDYHSPETFGVIFKDLAKVPYTNDYTFNITPISIIDKNFSLSDLQYKSPENAGSREIDFDEGESVYVSNCLESIELIEIEGHNNKTIVNSSALYRRHRNSTLPTFDEPVGKIDVASSVQKDKIDNNDPFTHIDETNPYNNVRIHDNLTSVQIRQESPGVIKILSDLKEHFNKLISERKGEDNSLVTTVQYSALGIQKVDIKSIPRYYYGIITNYKEDKDEYYLFPNTDTVSRHPYTYYLCPYGFSSNGKDKIKVFKNKDQTEYSKLIFK